MDLTLVLATLPGLWFAVARANDGAAPSYLQYNLSFCSAVHCNGAHCVGELYASTTATQAQCATQCLKERCKCWW